jgi:pimeloyl-ACP methyl ester carboxylesterase
MSHSYRIMQKYKSTNVRTTKIKLFIARLILLLLWKIARPLLSAVLKKLFFTPRQYPMYDLEKLYRLKGTRFTIPVHSKNIQCWKWGEGPGILFVHGWNGRGTQFVKFFDKFLEAGFSIIAFDSLAHGETEGKRSSYFEMTDVVRAILYNYKNTLNITGIVGHSLGAAAIINALEKDNTQLKTVLIAPALKLNELLNSTFRSLGVPDKIYNTIINDYEKKFNYDFKRDNPYNLLIEKSIPALIIHDKDDDTAAWEDSRTIAENNDDIMLETTIGLGHKWILINDDVVKRTLDYLKWS